MPKKELKNYLVGSDVIVSIKLEEQKGGLKLKDNQKKAIVYLEATPEGSKLEKYIGKQVFFKSQPDFRETTVNGEKVILVEESLITMLRG